MQILYIVSTLSRSGPTWVLHNILKHLDRSSFTPMIVTLSPEPEDSLMHRFEEMDIEIHCLNVSRLGYVVRGVQRLRRFISQSDPALVQTQGARPDAVAVDLQGTYPCVSLVHNMVYIDYPLKFGPVVGRVMGWRHMCAIRKLRNIVVVSQENAEWYRRREIETTVILNGVDDEAFAPPGEEERQQLRKKLNLPKDGKVFLSVGQMIARKSPHTLIRGFQSHQHNGAGVLLLVGRGPLEEPSRAIVADREKVRVLGFVENLTDYLRASDYFVSASVSEGLPNTVMEALSCGLPVCLSDIGPHREILDLNPRAGELFTVKDASAFGDALERLTEVDRQERSLAARDIVRNHLSARRMSQQYQTLYRQRLESQI